jgi:hypothetical protein
MNEKLMTIIREFSKLINPLGNYYKGDIIKWVNSKLESQSIEDKRLLKTNFLHIAITYNAENVKNINGNVLNAQRVILYFEEKSKYLNLKKGYDAAQIIFLFRILHKEIQVFENTDEEVMDVLYQVFDFGKDNIKSYFQRKIKKELITKTKKLFKCEWPDMYECKSLAFICEKTTQNKKI